MTEDGTLNECVAIISGGTQKCARNLVAEELWM